MAEVLNEYFSSVFTTEDISSLPVPFTKFEGNTSEELGQLCVTPEMIAKKIKKKKDNKSINGFHLKCSDIYMNNNKLVFVEKTKYLGLVTCNDLKMMKTCKDTCAASMPGLKALFENFTTVPSVLIYLCFTHIVYYNLLSPTLGKF